MTNLYLQPVVDIDKMNWEAELRWAESYRTEDGSMISLKQRRNSLFFIGGIQIDKYGNSNMIGVGKDYRRLKFRGPGPVGTTTFSAYVGRYQIFLNSHTKRVLVEQCDFISSVGWGQAGGHVRKNLGLPGAGPKYCITPLCIMDFEEKTKHMRLKYLHPGVRVDQVVENTGFELILPKNVKTTPEPNDDELHLLRTRIDPNGILRQSGS